MTSAFKKLASAALILAAGTFAVVRLRGPQGIPALLDKYREMRQLEDQNDALRADIEHRRQRNKELAKPDVMELEIRKRLYKLRKGETDFKLPQEAPRESN